MLETKLKEYIRNLVEEMDEDLDEITTTANIDGFDTPYAFLNKKSKKDKEKRKRIATQMGYRIVGEAFKSKGYKPKDPFGARIIQAINTNITASDVQDLKREGDDFETVTVSFRENRYKDGEVEKFRVVDKIFIRDGKFFRVNQWNGIID